MKKVTLLFAGAAIAVASMTGCIKREEVEAADSARSNGSARVMGYVLANTNEINDSTTAYQTFPYNDEFAPAGTKIIATYSTGDLDDGGAYSNLNETAQVSTTVKADGTYSFSIPANDNAVAVTIEVVEFITDKTVSRNTDNNFTTPNVSTTIKTEYSANANANVISGETVYLNINCGSGTNL